MNITTARFILKIMPSFLPSDNHGAIIAREIKRKSLVEYLKDQKRDKKLENPAKTYELPAAKPVQIKYGVHWCSLMPK